MESEIELTILMPCLNEADTLGRCIDKAAGYLSRCGLRGEILVADNGSQDGSRAIAVQRGAQVVDVPEAGYGAALQGGIAAARGRYVIMGDADDSYDFSRLDMFVDKLREGHDLVMGNRFLGGIGEGAMPALHRYLGNPVLSKLGRLFFSIDIGDFHCGLRGFDRFAIQSLGLRTTGMEFASEMVVKAALKQLRIAEVPTTLVKDGRNRPSHLRSWRDGWRHLRFLLMYSPNWLFLYPGVFLCAFGMLTMALVLPGPLRMGSVIFDVHTLLIGSSSLLIGIEVIIFFLLAKQYTINSRLLPEGPRYRVYRRICTLERVVALGVGMFLAGAAGVVWAVWTWQSTSFGALDYSSMMRIVVPSATFLAIGIQLVMAGFLASIFDLKVTG